MGKPVSLLESLSNHALQRGITSYSVVYEGQFQRAWGPMDGVQTRILNFPRKGRDAKEPHKDLEAAAKKPVLTVLNGRRYFLRVILEDDAFDVRIEPAPALDPSAPPVFTTKQAQYLAYIHYYTRIHRVAPAEADMQSYFQVSAPAVHDMVKTLERNGLIERTHGVGRSIRVLVRPEHLPPLL